jgi:hypothetical protein
MTIPPNVSPEKHEPETASPFPNMGKILSSLPVILKEKELKEPPTLNVGPPIKN